MMGYQNILDIVTIALLSLARYYAFTSQRNLTSCKIILVFVTASIIAIISSILLLWSATINIKSYAYMTLLYATGAIVLQTVIVSSNIMLLQKINKIAQMSRTCNINIDYQKGVTRTVLLISISLTVCILPVVISLYVSSFIQLKNGDTTVIIYPYLQYSYWIFILNSGINAVIYLSRSK